MSTMFTPMAFDLVLPWQEDIERERAFKRILQKIFIPLLILFIAVPFLHILKSELDQQQKATVTANVILQPKKIETPKVPKPVDAAPVVQQEPPPVAVPVPPVEKPQPKVQAKADKNPKGENKIQKASAPVVDAKTSVAQAQGLADLSSQLRSLRSAVNLEKMQVKNVSDNIGGTVARADRSVLGAENAVRKSNGIAVNDVAMKGGAVALADHQSTQVDNVAGSDMPDGTSLSNISGQSGRRDMESIRRTLEETKSSVYMLYQRVLLEKPQLAGKFTFKIVIQPNGSISDLKLVSSELGVAELEQHILERIRQINFGAKDVAPTILEYKFVFLPS